MEPECRIRLEVFEGPLDLLLHLINKNRLSITDISISLVTNQYLEYLELLKALDIEVAAEYLVMAATLMQIKSRRLLPAADPPHEDDQPTMDILGSLEELKRIKALTDILEKRPVLGKDVFLPVPESTLDNAGKRDASRESMNFDVSILDLMDAFKRVLGNRHLPRTIEIIRAKVDLETRIEEIEQILQKGKPVNFSQLFERGASRHVLIVSFLAILELAKRGLIRLSQEPGSNKIMLSARKTDRKGGKYSVPTPGAIG